MHIYKMSTTSYGEITGIQEIYADDYVSAGIEGYLVDEEATALEMLADIGAFSATHWYDIDNDLINLRPEMGASAESLSITVGEDVVLIDVPEGVIISIEDGDSFTMDDSGIFEFPTDFADTYKISLELFPFKPMTFEVIVNAS